MRFPLVIANSAHQNGGLSSELVLPPDGFETELVLDRLEQIPIQNGFLFAAMDRAPIDQLADEEPVPEQISQGPNADGMSPRILPLEST